MHGLESHGVDRDIARVDLRDGVAVVGDALEAAAASTRSEGISRT